MQFRSLAHNGFGLGEGGLCGNKSLPAFAKPVLYEVPTYLALNSNRSDKQKNKKKKKGYGKRLIWKRNCKRCIT